jgi:hypothetical protein
MRNYVRYICFWFSSNLTALIPVCLCPNCLEMNNTESGDRVLPSVEPLTGLGKWQLNKNPCASNSASAP